MEGATYHVSVIGGGPLVTRKSHQHSARGSKPPTREEQPLQFISPVAELPRLEKELITT